MEGKAIVLRGDPVKPLVEALLVELFERVNGAEDVEAGAGRLVCLVTPVGPMTETVETVIMLEFDSVYGADSDTPDEGDGIPAVPDTELVTEGLVAGVSVGPVTTLEFEAGYGADKEVLDKADGLMAVPDEDRPVVEPSVGVAVVLEFDSGYGADEENPDGADGVMAVPGEVGPRDGASVDSLGALEFDCGYGVDSDVPTAGDGLKAVPDKDPVNEGPVDTLKFDSGKGADKDIPDIDDGFTAVPEERGEEPLPGRTVSEGPVVRVPMNLVVAVEFGGT